MLGISRVLLMCFFYLIYLYLSDSELINKQMSMTVDKRAHLGPLVMTRGTGVIHGKYIVSGTVIPYKAQSSLSSVINDPVG